MLYRKEPFVAKNSMFGRFLGYYKPQMHLFIADTICALVLAGIDLRFRLSCAA